MHLIVRVAIKKGQNMNMRITDGFSFLVVLEEDGKRRLKTLETIPDFNTHLSITSIVGKRGSGKSTVCSLLSGNSSMFEVLPARQIFIYIGQSKC